MVQSDIIQNRIHPLGQSQQDRFSPALESDFVLIDERNTVDYLKLLKRFADKIRFYSLNHQDTPSNQAPGVNFPKENWSNFFPFDDLSVQNWLDALDDQTSPHLGLLLSFLKLYEAPQALLNALKDRHLKFYYRDVLRMQPRSAVPDRAHVIVDLKKGSDNQLITPSMSMLAGKDSQGNERVYRPVRETVINNARVETLRSVFIDDQGLLRYAPIANSTDGLGGMPQSEETLMWSGFGHSQLPLADVGFAFAAPVLKMAEGRRTINIELELGNATNLAGLSLQQVFRIYLSGEKNWLGPYNINASLIDDNLLQLQLVLDDAEPAISEYIEAVHAANFTTQSPVIQVLLNTDVPAPYREFVDIELISARIDVDVTGANPLKVSNDFGVLNANKKFIPFGSEPKPGAKLIISSDEIFSKQLDSLEVNITWSDIPADFSDHYQNYSVPNSLRPVNNQSFTTNIRFNDGGNWSVDESHNLFDSDDALQQQLIGFSKNNAGTNHSYQSLVYSLVLANNTWSSTIMNFLILSSPTTASANFTKVQPKSGELVMQLNRGFLHDAYRKNYVENVIKFSKSRNQNATLLDLQEPVIPAISELKLNYSASSGLIDMTRSSAEDFADQSLVFFQIGYFGQMREHRFIREQFEHVASKPVTLFHSIEARGELLIGLSNLDAHDSVSLLLQLAEGSIDPDLAGESISWSVLCDNYWKELSDTNLVLDTSDQFLTSGILQFIIPAEATTTNTLLPRDYLWLKASVIGHETAVAKVVDIVANAVEVVLELPTKKADQLESAPEHLETALPAASISKFSNGILKVKGLEQRYSSSGGMPVESDRHFNTRVSELIRHKNRCLSPWDFERTILANFPNVYKAKCIPHARPGSWTAPGHLMMVLVPDLRNKNAINPLEPRVDSQTIQKVKNKLLSCCGMQTQVHVSNPRYQAVQFKITLKFHPGYEFNYYRDQLDRLLQQTLSPWVASDEQNVEIEFGGVLYDSGVLKIIEDLDYVDYITEFLISTEINGVMTGAKDGVVRAVEPDVILVSSPNHLISEAVA